VLVSINDEDMTEQPTGSGTQPAPEPTAPGRYPELSNRAIGWAAVVLIVLGASLATVLLIVFGNGQHPAQLDAIKTAGTIVLGTGGAAALWLTARRQRTAEITMNQQREANEAAKCTAEITLKQQREANEAAKHDATERRLTELYVKAVEQLGSDKAAVRHGGLYALERVAQDNPNQRQTIVDVVCAYLRAPYTPPGESSARRLGVKRPLPTSTPTRTARAPLVRGGVPAAPTQRGVVGEARQEREVRLTAQRLLARHLLPGDADRPVDTFWAGISLDLNGATLINFDLSHCHVEDVSFTGATFVEFATFEGATFTGSVGFLGASFTESALFHEATITGHAILGGATFTRLALFRNTRFTGLASFHGTTFTENADFAGATFNSEASFNEAGFGENAIFNFATFAGRTSFHKSPFTNNASFVAARFTGDTDFGGATFNGETWFGGATFTARASFGSATFAEQASFDTARFAEWANFDGATFAKGTPDEVAPYLVSPSNDDHLGSGTDSE
jgi:uncharacterized protein YjbI with pentapeptide repeats